MVSIDLVKLWVVFAQGICLFQIFPPTRLNYPDTKDSNPMPNDAPNHSETTGNNKSKRAYVVWMLFWHCIPDLDDNEWNSTVKKVCQVKNQALLEQQIKLF